mgnify:CR=1 FL=1
MAVVNALLDLDPDQDGLDMERLVRLALAGDHADVITLRGERRAAWGGVLAARWGLEKAQLPSGALPFAAWFSVY